MRKVLLGLSSAIWLSACGDSNFNEMLLVSDKQKNALDQLLQEAKYHYDKGDADKAMALTEKAAAINPYNEETLILKAYIYLSRAGLDAFSLSKNLIEQSEKKADDTTSATDKTSESFSAMASVLSLTPADLDTMGTSSTAAGTEYKLYYPYPADQARSGGSLAITAINQAIATLCPLVADSTRSSTDARHSCEKSPYALQRSGKSHFAWALAHLGEAIAFYTVVLYDDGNGKPNVQDVADSIDKNNISQLVSRVTALQGAVSSIFPTGDAASNSMLNAMFSNLEATNKGFGAIEGVPPTVTKTVSDSIENLKAKISKIGGTANESSKQNEALRNSLTTGLSTDLKKKIESTTNISDADKIKACCAYRAINTQADDPSNCSTVPDSSCVTL